MLSAAPSSTSSWPAGGLDGPDPLVIHLPGADGTSESSPADPASAGLPATPTVVTDGNSLALRDPAAVQHRQQDQLGFRLGSGSKTLSTMLPRSPSTLQPRVAAETPATRALGPTGLQARPAGPLGFLPALQWSNNTMYWGSPIGGTLYINPPVDEPAAAAAAAASNSKQRPSRANRQFWGSPIGGTLYINPPVEEGPTPSTPQQDTSAPSRQHSSSNVFWGSPIGGTLYINPHVDDSLVHSSAGQLATGLPQAAAGAAAAAVAAPSSSTASPSSTKSRHSRLPFPLFQWGSSNKAHWGAPIGGTLYINPQAPADWQEGSWGSGSSGFGSSSGGGSPGSGSSSSSNGGGNGAGAGSGSRGGSSSGNGVTSKQRSTVYASARAGQAAWGGVAPGVGLAKLGVGLMAAVAAAAMAVYLRAAPGSTSSTTTSTYSPSAPQHNGQTSSAAAAGSAADVSAAGGAGRASVPAAAAEDAPEGPGFHQWMVQRLQSTLDAFEAEQSLLRTELAVLNSLPVAKKGMLGSMQGLKRWVSRGAGGASSSSSTSSGGSPAALSEAAAVASALQGGTTKAGALSAAEVTQRVAEIQEQLESIDVLKAALRAEMGEQQQLLQKAQHEQQVAQDQLTALVGR